MTSRENHKADGAQTTRAGLQPTSAGNRVTLKNGKIIITDGPFTESKEIVGGYAIIDAKSREEALGFARCFMELHQTHWPTFEGECEVRPLEQEAQPASYSGAHFSR